MGSYLRRAMVTAPVGWVALVVVAMAMTAAHPEEAYGLRDEFTGGTQSPELAESLEDTSYEGATMKSGMSVSNPESYFRIPNFVYQHLAQEVKDRTAEQCAMICGAKPECRSFSWGADNKCLWSPESIVYNSAYDFFAKTNAASGAPYNYYEFIGVMYHEPSAKASKDVTEEQCKAQCDASESCMSFSYSAADKKCFISGKGVHYNSEFTYYEKPQEKISPEFKRGKPKEVRAKAAAAKNMVVKAQPKEQKQSAPSSSNDVAQKEKQASASVAVAEAEKKAAEKAVKEASDSGNKELANVKLEAANKKLRKAEAKEKKAAEELEKTEVEKPDKDDKKARARSLSEAVRAAAAKAVAAAKAAEQKVVQQEVNKKVVQAKKTANAAVKVAKKAGSLSPAKARLFAKKAEALSAKAQELAQKAKETAKNPKVLLNKLSAKNQGAVAA